MTIYQKTAFKDLYCIRPQKHQDVRGYFAEIFHQEKFFNATGIAVSWVQENQSFSKKGVVRGLHFQTKPFAQAKCVRCTHGRIWDVVLDIRPEEPTFGQHFALELSAKNQMQLYIPKGFAHGFATLSATATVVYGCSTPYTPEAERCILFDDPEMGIHWPLDTPPILSPKDRLGLGFKAAKLWF